jgi:hypothetical protein
MNYLVFLNCLVPVKIAKSGVLKLNYVLITNVFLAIYFKANLFSHWH